MAKTQKQKLKDQKEQIDKLTNQVSRLSQLAQVQDIRGKKDIEHKEMLIEFFATILEESPQDIYATYTTEEGHIHTLTTNEDENIPHQLGMQVLALLDTYTKYREQYEFDE